MIVYIKGKRNQPFGNTNLSFPSSLDLGLLCSGSGDLLGYLLRSGYSSGSGLLSLVLVLLDSLSLSLLGGLGGLLLLEIIKRETDDSLLDLLNPSGTTTSHLLSLTLLVHATPVLSPAKLNGLETVLEEACSLGAKEEVNLTIPSHIALASTRVYTVFRELAKLGLDYHLSLAKSIKFPTGDDSVMFQSYRF